MEGNNIVDIKEYLRNLKEENSINQEKIAKENKKRMENIEFNNGNVEMFNMVNMNSIIAKGLKKSTQQQETEIAQQQAKRRQRKISQAKRAKQEKFKRRVAGGVLSIIAFAGAFNIANAMKADAQTVENSPSHGISALTLNANAKNAINSVNSEIRSYLCAKQVKQGSIDGIFRTGSGGSIYMVRTYIPNGANAPTEACYPITLTSEQKQALNRVELLERYINGEDVDEAELDEAMITINSLLPALEEATEAEKEEAENSKQYHSTNDELGRD